MLCLFWREFVCLSVRKKKLTFGCEFYGFWLEARVMAAGAWVRHLSSSPLIRVSNLTMYDKQRCWGFGVFFYRGILRSLGHVSSKTWQRKSSVCTIFRYIKYGLKYSYAQYIATRALHQYSCLAIEQYALAGFSALSSVLWKNDRSLRLYCVEG